MSDVENSRFFVKRELSFIYLGSKKEEKRKSLGDWSDGGTPGHIPNPEVKTVSADSTWGAAPWESRSLPRDFFLNLFLSI